MSTILKALKRIDQTNPPPEDLQTWPLRIDTKKTVSTRVHKIWLLRRVYLVVILAVVVIAAGWLVYSQKHLLIPGQSQEKISENGPIYQAKINQTARKSQDPAKKEASTLNRQNTLSAEKSEDNPARVDRQPGALPQIPVRQKKPIFSSSTKSQPLGTTSTAKSKISPSPMAASKKSIQSNTRPSAAAPMRKSKSRVLRTYRRLNDSKLKLQAIAWSNVAAERIAVINGHIVREGESVEGFSVNQIRQEDVIVNDGSESWQLEFGLK